MLSVHNAKQLKVNKQKIRMNGIFKVVKKEIIENESLAYLISMLLVCNTKA